MGGPKLNQVYFNHREVLAMSMALSILLEDLSATDDKNWNEDAKKQRKEMRESANSAMDKLVKFCGAQRELPPYNEGDEKQFMN